MALLYCNLPMHDSRQQAVKGGFLPNNYNAITSVTESDILSLFKFRGQWSTADNQNILSWLTQWGIWLRALLARMA